MSWKVSPLSSSLLAITAERIATLRECLYTVSSGLLRFCVKVILPLLSPNLLVISRTRVSSLSGCFPALIVVRISLRLKTETVWNLSNSLSSSVSGGSGSASSRIYIPIRSKFLILSIPWLVSLVSRS